ncbi:DUF2844 domain-containing protein [Pararobbsia silviterrae]|uniref:DUF2844 domain-containing protein n=1 Tax=Pararobbsia silviterrae TaxID=1792498 RepID=A0A494Y9N8_9BURK|nr:DUF2844 domain-containing protein [Pararobbsia silviterrae]RKP59432.1 DUF2844 domain-containing protein [Pararobbsia silviterrae]
MLKPYSALAVMVSTVLSVNAYAALGGSPTLPAAAASTMAGVSIAAATSSRYTVREETLANGTTEREYLTTSGEVFGIGWSGPFQPDLQNFMGSDVFSEYSAALRAATGHRGGVSMTFDGVVVQIGGHPRHFVGRAYVVDLVPSGVDVSAIQ